MWCSARVQHALNGKEESDWRAANVRSFWGLFREMREKIFFFLTIIESSTIGCQRCAATLLKLSEFQRVKCDSKHENKLISTFLLPRTSEILSRFQIVIILYFVLFFLWCSNEQRLKSQLGQQKLF